jgi:hypothetical protein
MNSPVIPCRAQDHDGFVKTIIFFSFFYNTLAGSMMCPRRKLWMQDFNLKNPIFGCKSSLI